MGFFVWYSISSTRTVARTLTIPVYFDNMKEGMQIDSAEQTAITVAGTRDLIQKVSEIGSLHIDTTELSHGKQLIHASYKNFMLPTAIKVVNCMPIEVTFAPPTQIDKTST
jgi:YbbR domain-containing protein